MLLAFSAFIFARLAMMAAAHPDREAPEMSVLRKWAEEREEELCFGKVEDGEQISITELIDIPDAETSEEPDEATAEEKVPETSESAPTEETVE